MPSLVWEFVQEFQFPPKNRVAVDDYVKKGKRRQRDHKGEGKESVESRSCNARELEAGDMYLCDSIILQVRFSVFPPEAINLVPHLEVMDVVVRGFRKLADARIQGRPQTALARVVIHGAPICKQANDWLPNLSTQRINLEQQK